MPAILSGTQFVSSNTANTNITINDWAGTSGGVYWTPQYIIGDGVGDPLNQKPRPETPEAWLRRRVREVQWKAA